jgi:hypothetical protein
LDEVLGGALRIPIEEIEEHSGAAVMFLAEATWCGIAAPDNRYGCDVCITLG